MVEAEVVDSSNQLIVKLLTLDRPLIPSTDHNHISGRTGRVVNRSVDRQPLRRLQQNDDFSAIFKAIVNLENGDDANSREAQLQSSDQALFDECDSLQQPPRRRASQSVLVLYSELVEEEFKRLLGQSKAR